MISLGTESPWCVNYSFNSLIDFCVSVLESDGLQVSPFDRHQEGSGILRSAGLNAEGWRSWLANIVATQDARLYWHIENQQLSVAEDAASFETMASWQNQQIDVPSVSSSLENIKTWQEQQYQQASTRLRQMSREAEPPDIWIGEPIVGKLLKELWQIYLPTARERENNLRQRGEYAEITHQLYQQLQPYHTRLAILQIFHVDYPTPILYLVPPVSVILSINGISAGDSFSQCVIRAAEALATTNNQS